MCLSYVLFAKSDQKTGSRESNNVNRKLSFMKSKQKMFLVRISTKRRAGERFFLLFSTFLSLQIETEMQDTSYMAQVTPVRRDYTVE